MTFSAFAGVAGMVALVLASHAMEAALLAACLLLLSGWAQARLSSARARRRRLRKIRNQIGREHGVGRMCVLMGAAGAVLAMLLPPAAAVAAGFLASTFAFTRFFAVTADSASAADRLDLASSSAADECTCIERLARRLSTWRWFRPAQHFADRATRAVPPGENGYLQWAVLVLLLASVCSYGLIGTALGAELLVAEVQKGSADGPARPPEPDLGPDEPDLDPPRTYAEECPEMPNPLDLGPEIGPLFRSDGAFKAGCASALKLVPQTGAEVSPGVCEGRLRSVGVLGGDGSAALLYGRAARFAWERAEEGDLVGAEAARPEGGDVDVVSTLAGTYGFVRRPASGLEGEEARSCTDVTGTDRPFAEMPPPMLILWRDLLDHRELWSWPIADPIDSAAVEFTAYPGVTPVATSSCDSEWSCSLEMAGGVTWQVSETAFVSLAELSRYMPPEEVP